VTRTRALGAALATVLMLTGCGDDADDDATDPADERAYSDDCGWAVEEASETAQTEDRAAEDLDPAIATCDSLEALRAATADHPGALDGDDLETFVANRCSISEDEAVTGSDICAEVAATG
jgi:hypothetical protein